MKTGVWAYTLPKALERLAVMLEKYGHQSVEFIHKKGCGIETFAFILNGR